MIKYLIGLYTSIIFITSATTLLDNNQNTEEILNNIKSYISHCKCGVCNQRRQDGLPPIH